MFAQYSCLVSRFYIMYFIPIFCKDFIIMPSRVRFLCEINIIISYYYHIITDVEHRFGVTGFQVTSE